MIARALLIVIALALAGAGVQTWRLDRAQAALAAEKLARAQEHDQALTAANDAQSNYRLLEAAMTHKLQEAQDAGRKDHERMARAAAADRAELGRMRDQLDAYAAGGGPAADDSLEACRARAAILVQAVEAGLRVQDAMARAYGDLAADYRTLFAGWPESRNPQVTADRLGASR